MVIRGRPSELGRRDGDAVSRPGRSSRTASSPRGKAAKYIVEWPGHINEKDRGHTPSDDVHSSRAVGPRNDEATDGPRDLSSSGLPGAERPRDTQGHAGRSAFRRIAPDVPGPLTPAASARTLDRTCRFMTGRNGTGPATVRQIPRGPRPAFPPWDERRHLSTEYDTGACERSATIAEVRSSLRSGQTTVLERLEGELAAVRADRNDLGAFVAVADDDVLDLARAADERIRARGAEAWSGQPLLGITVSVKDLIQTETLPTRRGSLVANARPRLDPPAVARLRAAGAIVIGKTTTSEHGWSASTVSRITPPTRNPWDRGRTAGGSSGGAAAAVASGLGTVALGTDGAGSIRIPASFCGVVGFKPSLGKIPYVPTCADRLAHVGPLATSTDDIIELMGVLVGPDSADPDSVASMVAPPRSDGLRVGWVEFPGTSPEVARACVPVRALVELRQHRFETIAVPFTDPYPAIVDIIAAAEAAGIGPEDEEWGDPGRLAVADYGGTIPAAQLVHAEQVRMALRTTMRSVMDDFDLLVMPTVSIEPFAMDAVAPPWAAAPEDLLWLAWSPASYPFNMTGQPALSLPIGRTASGLPVGIQIVGPCGGDDLVTSFARDLETDRGPFPCSRRTHER